MSKLIVERISRENGETVDQVSLDEAAVKVCRGNGWKEWQRIDDVKCGLEGGMEYTTTGFVYRLAKLEI